MRTPETTEQKWKGMAMFLDQQVPADDPRMAEFTGPLKDESKRLNATTMEMGAAASARMGFWRARRNGGRGWPTGEPPQGDPTCPANRSS